MRFLFVAALTIAGLSTGVAFARETAEEAFPPGALYSYNNLNPKAVVPAIGSQGTVQSTNGLPPGFFDGTPAKRQQAAVLAYYRRDAARRAAVLMAQGKAAATPRG